MKGGKVAFCSVGDEDFILRECDAEIRIPRRYFLAQKRIAAIRRITAKAAVRAHIECRFRHGTRYGIGKRKRHIAYAEAYYIRFGMFFFIFCQPPRHLGENIIFGNAREIFVCRNQSLSSVS